MKAVGTRHVEIGFVDRCHLYLRSEGAEDLVNFFGAFSVTLGMSIDEDGVGALLGGGAKRHCRVNTEFTSFVGGGGDDSTLAALSADDDCLSLQRWVVELFYGDEEGVHIDVKDGAGESGLVQRCHARRNSSSVVRASLPRGGQPGAAVPT